MGRWALACGVTVVLGALLGCASHSLPGDHRIRGAQASERGGVSGGDYASAAVVGAAVVSPWMDRKSQREMDKIR